MRGDPTSGLSWCNAGSFKDMERDELEALGEAGGGMAIALGIRGRGVFRDGRPLIGVVEGIPPTLETRPPRPGFGVLKGDTMGRVGDVVKREVCAGDGIERAGVLIPASRELSCFAVMDTYLEAREPAVILLVKDELLELGVFVDFASVRSRAPAAGVVPGVARPVDLEGVIRPFEIEVNGVVRPFGIDIEVEGVMRPDIDGVARPPREEATEDGRRTAPTPTVGGESFVVAIKTPQLVGHEKYCFLAY